MLKRITSISVAILAVVWILTGGTRSSHPQESISISQSDGGTGRNDDKKSVEKEGIVNVQILQQGTYSGLKDPVEQVAQSRDEWEEVWKKHVSLLIPQPPLPQIDFDSFAVVVIASGEQRTGGYSVELKDVSADGDDIVVTYRRIEPAPNSFTMQVLTQPFLMLQVQKPKGKIKLVKSN